ncbi:MAG: hypothetical protein ISS79_08215 [Phycisphaerae bacterium]|nr:hypothetical protein [Phycisphaerae bacterium]
MLASDTGRILHYSRTLSALAACILVPAITHAKIVAEWDFTKGTLGWTGNARVKELKSSPEGLLVRSTGEDPWIEGPGTDLPGAETARVKIRMKSTADAGAQLFYGRAFTEDKSVRFSVHDDGEWHDYSLLIHDRLTGPTRFRLDPCSNAGELTIAHIKVEAIGKLLVPALQKPKHPERNADASSVKSANLVFEHHKRRWGNFVIEVNGVEMAAGHQRDILGLIIDEKPQWLNLADAQVSFQARPGAGARPKANHTTVAAITDRGGATWRIQRTVKPGPQGTLLIETQLKVDKDRDVIHIPWLTLFPGLGTFGRSKSQGLLPGLEYLCDEPSSSTADIAEPKNARRVPDPVKVAFPLMAIAHNENYIGLIWEPSDITAAVFDSPDRIYNSDAHLMALSAPGVGSFRFENAFCAHTPFKLEANKVLKVSATIIADKGKTIIPAVKQYVELRGLPDVPQFDGGLAAATNLLAHGWLDSKINHDGLFRHAVWGTSFGPQPAADAAMYIDWLIRFVEDKNLRERLRVLEETALSKIPAGQPFSGSVGHAHQPAAPFIFGRLAEFVRQRRGGALGQLRRFDENGILPYQPGKADYSKTHFAKHANGLGGRLVADILEAATLCADKELITKALDLLDKQTALYADTVPRGAQTWEVPLHTPDILASAHMVKAYTLAYIISERKEYLDQARYWAWTGVPFVYLHPPTPGRVGNYSTIAVMGATNWRAPVWFGQPVQWCGLVYCSALHLLSEVDPQAPWKKIAKGITAAGLQMTWPTTDTERQGLLPDFFHLLAQRADGPAINPGTVQAHIPEYFAVGKNYDLKKLPARGWFVHAPCKISRVEESKDLIKLTVDGRARKQYQVLISGIQKEPAQVTAADPRREALTFGPAQTKFHPGINALIITLNTPAQIKITP